jgi:hypothetical protein
MIKRIHSASHLYLGLMVVGMLLRGASNASAQQDCTKYMGYGIYDKYDTLSTSSKFQQVQSLLKQSNFTSYNQAQDSLVKAGLDAATVDGIFSFDYGGHDAKTEWRQWQSAFLQSNFQQIQSDQVCDKH